MKQKILIQLLYIFVRVWMSTWRVRVKGLQHVDTQKKANRPVVFAMWHGQLFPALKHYLGRKVVVPTSQSKDGEIIAQIEIKMGYIPARGSSSKGGAKALIAAKREMDAGADAVITVDGPKGPRFSVKPGVVFLAKKTGRVIVPVFYDCKHFIRFNSWDKLVLPAPFSRITATFGEPFELDEDTSTESIDRDVELLASRMKEMTSAYSPHIV